MNEKQAQELITAIKKVATEVAKNNIQLEKIKHEIEMGLKSIAIAVGHTGQTYYND